MIVHYGPFRILKKFGPIQTPFFEIGPHQEKNPTLDMCLAHEMFKNPVQ